MTKTTEKRLVQMPAVEHIKSIKQKLREAKSKYEHNTGASKPLTAYSLHKLLEEKELPTLAISALQNMFNPELNSKTIDVTMVAILCKLFDVNLSYVLALPEDQAMLPEYSSYNSAFQALTDPYYLGTFTGYMLRTQQGKYHRVEIDIHIRRDPNRQSESRPDQRPDVRNYIRNPRDQTNQHRIIKR